MDAAPPAVKPREGSALGRAAVALAGGVARVITAVFLVWLAWFFVLCLPYFMLPYTMLKERKAAILARVPEVARLDALDEAGLRALTAAVIPLLNDGDKSLRGGARDTLSRVAVRPGAPKDLLIPALVADLEAARQVPASAAWTLAALGDEGKAALIAAVTGPGEWAPSAAAHELGRMKPRPLDAIPALEEALAKAPEHRRRDFRLALDRVRGRRR